MNNELGYYVTDDGDEIFSSVVLFNDLSVRQKLAIINFLMVIAESNVVPPAKLSRNKQDFFFVMFYEFGVSEAEYQAYLSLGGRDWVIADIKSLSTSNMHGLTHSTLELWNLDAETTEKEYAAQAAWLIDIGMTDEEWCDSINSF
jgi:hypothetical protein